MKNLLISSFNMEVGGVERSLLSMLNNFDYKKNNIDLMLYSHTGDFMNLLPSHPRLLEELKTYKTFGMSIGQVLRNGNLLIGLARILAKYKANLSKSSENCYRQQQYMWKYSLPFLPHIKKQYDTAISYLGPHYFIGDKVTAKNKIAWIHTDYLSLETDEKMDLKMWKKFNHIVAVSPECRNSFLKKYGELEGKVVVIENLHSPEMVRQMADEEVSDSIASDHRFKVMTVARLSHAKGIDNAVKALKILKDKGYDNIAWYVVGYGGDESQIKDLIARNNLDDCFILLGKKTNPYPYMKACNLYVQPSRYEGKAVTVTEAKILGKPILITNYATAKSQVEDGVDGIITELSIQGIAEGIEMLYQDDNLLKKLAAHCQKTDYGNSSELEKLYSLLS